MHKISSSIQSPALDMAEKGWCLVQNAISEQLLESLRLEIESASVECRKIQIKNCLSQNTSGTLHHLLAFQGSFLTLLEAIPAQDLIQSYFEAPFILNSFGGVINRKENQNYVGKVHRDVRFFTGKLPLMLNMLIMLDDFTLENGATYLLSGSHHQAQKPEESLFYQKAEQACGKAGSCLLFNSNLWHAAGLNHTDQPRRALTLTWTRSSIKQQLDYVRLLGEDAVFRMSDKVKQLLGYYSRTPSSLEEWYRPEEERYYRQGQD